MFTVHKSRAPKLGERRMLMRDALVGTLDGKGDVHTQRLYPGDRVRVIGMNVQLLGEYVEVVSLRVERLTDGVGAELTEEYQSKLA